MGNHFHKESVANDKPIVQWSKDNFPKPPQATISVVRMIHITWDTHEYTTLLFSNGNTLLKRTLISLYFDECKTMLIVKLNSVLEKDIWMWSFPIWFSSNTYEVWYRVIFLRMYFTFFTILVHYINIKYTAEKRINLI